MQKYENIYLEIYFGYFTMWLLFMSITDKQAKGWKRRQVQKSRSKIGAFMLQKHDSTELCDSGEERVKRKKR